MAINIFQASLCAERFRDEFTLHIIKKTCSIMMQNVQYLHTGRKRLT